MSGTIIGDNPAVEHGEPSRNKPDSIAPSRFGRCSMASKPDNTAAKVGTLAPEPLFDVRFDETLDFVDQSVTQAEISLIEHYFQDFLKGQPP